MQRNSVTGLLFKGAYEITTNYEPMSTATGLRSGPLFRPMPTGHYLQTMDRTPELVANRDLRNQVRPEIKSTCTNIANDPLILKSLVSHQYLNSIGKIKNLHFGKRTI